MHAGMDVARLNFSHGTYPEHQKRMEMVAPRGRERRPDDLHLARPAGAEDPHRRLKYRTPVALKAGSRVTITPKDIPGTASVISTTFQTLAQEIKSGDRILLSDGLIELRVHAIHGNEVECEVINGGMLGEHKGINLPGIVLSVPSMTEKDAEDLAFGIKHGVDMVAASFIRTAEDVRAVKRFIAEHNSDVPLIAKLESRRRSNTWKKFLKSRTA